MANITYTQEDETTAPGTIEFIDGNFAESKEALSGPPNNGRLDNLGDLVFAEFITSSVRPVRVECIRTSDKTMTIRIILSNLDPSDYSLYYSQREIVKEDVPITFK